MKYLIIGTTSINRPDLHNKTLVKWIEWIRLSLKTQMFKIVWIINIDVIPQLTEYTWEQTQDNYKRLFEEKIDDMIFLNTQKTFFASCTNICNEISKYIDILVNTIHINPFHDVKIMWLEDDWKLNTNIHTTSFIELIQFYSTTYSVINLSFIRNNYIWALAPCIISYLFWKSNHHDIWTHVYKHGNLDIDPENVLGSQYLKNSNIVEKNIYNLTVINKKITHDYLKTNDFLNKTNSYYTIGIGANADLPVSDRCICIQDVKKLFANIDLFIRITPKMSEDVGREYMESKKVKKQFVNGKCGYENITDNKP